MSRKGSTRRIWSGMTALSLLSFFIFIVMTAIVPVAYGQSGMKIVLPSGKTIAQSGAPPAAKGLAAPMSLTGGDPVDRMVGPILRINQDGLEGDCTTPGGCTQNSPSIAKSSSVLVMGYQNSWGLYQGTPTHVGLFSYSVDGGATWSQGKLLLPTDNPDQILGPPHIVSDGNGNFWYAAEYATITGDCAIAVGRSQYDYMNLDLTFEPPTLVASSSWFIPGAKFQRPRLALDRRNGNLYLVYTYVNSPFGSCGTMDQPGDPGVTSWIFVHEYDPVINAWIGPAPLSAPFTGPAFVDGADVTVDANTLPIPFTPGFIFGAWEQYLPGVSHTIEGMIFSTGLLLGAPATVGPVKAVAPPFGYSGTLVYDPNCFPGPVCNWVQGLRSAPSVAANSQRFGEYYAVWNSAFEDFIFTESFEGPFPPSGWTVTDATSSGVVWNRNDDLGFINQTGGTGYSAMILTTPGPLGVQTALDSPPIPVPPVFSPVTRATLSFRNLYSNLDPSSPQSCTVLVSSDGGATWTPLLTFSASTGPGVLTADLSPWAGQEIILRWERFDGLAIDPDYWQIDDVKITVSDAVDSDILFSKTEDFGFTWSTPTRVNDNQILDLTAQFMPQLAVRTSDGLIKVAFYDQRIVGTDPPGGANTNVFVAESVDSGLTFEPNVKITKTPMDWAPEGLNQLSDLDPNFGLRIGATMDADHIYLAWSGSPAEGAEGPDVYTTYAQNIPEIQQPADIDFGIFCAGGDASKTLEFQVFNTGTSDLSITMAFANPADAHFVVTPFPETTPLVIAPGEHMAFSVTFTQDAADFGLISNSIIISTNDPNTPEVLVNVFANVVAPTWTVSATSIDFGGVPWDDATNPAGFTKTMPLIVTNTSACPVVIEAPINFAPDTDFSSTTPVPFTLTPGSNARIDIVFNPASAGAKSATLTLIATSPASPPDVVVTLNGIGLEPSMALELPGFGGVPIDDAANPGNFAADRTLKIHNTGTGNLIITGIGSSNPEFQILNAPASANVGPNDFLNVTVRFNPDPLANTAECPNHSSTITVTTNPVIAAGNTILATGAGLEPIIRLDLPSFGSVPADDATNPGNFTKESVLKIHNNGQANLSVSAITFTDVLGTDSWVVSPTVVFPLLIPAGSFENVTIQFNPDNLSSGDRTATVNVANNTSANTCNAVLDPATITASGFAFTGVIDLELQSNGPVPWDDKASPGFEFSDRTLHIHNTGTANIVVTGITFSGADAADFSLTETIPTEGITISPDSFFNVTIRFNPSSAGAKTATVNVNFLPGPLTGTITATGFGLTSNIYLQVNDFGAVGVDDPTNPVYLTEQTLMIHNTGSANLIIKEVEVDDECTDFFVINGPADGTVVSPDANLPVTIRFNAAAAGERNCEIEVTYYTNYETETTAEMEINAHGIGLAPSASLELPGFGGVPIDDAANPGNFAADRILKIHNTGQANLQVTGIASSNGEFAISPETALVFPINIAPNDSFNVTVRFNPSALAVPPGVCPNHSSTITVSTAPLGNLTVAATGEGLEPIIRLDLPSFGSVPADDDTNPGNNERDSTLRIHNNGSANLSVSGITFTGVVDADSWTIVSPVVFPLIIPPGSFQNVTIRFNPDDTASGGRTATVNVANNTAANTCNPVSSPATITASGFAFTGVIDFELQSNGPVPWDDDANPGFESSDRTLHIHNTGTANIVVTSIDFSSGDAADFSLTETIPAGGVTISPDSFFNVTIRFNPSFQGAKATNVVVSFEPFGQTAQIAATGFGLNPAIYLQLADFGVVPWDDEANAFKYVDRVLAVHNTGAANLIIQSVVGSGDYTVIGGPADGTSVSPDATLPVTVRFNPSVTGQITGTVTVTYYTNFTDEETTTATIIASGIGLGILPPYLELPYFGGVPVDDSTNPVFYTDKELQIHNIGDANLILKSVAGAGDFAVVNGPADGTKISPNATLPVTVRFNPSSGGLRQGTITVTYYSDFAGGSIGTTNVITITAEGTGLEPSVYTVLSDFGGMPVEDATINDFYFSYFTDRELKIQNTGDANISVTAITITGTNGADFAITNPPAFPVSIGPGKALGNISVRFNPSGSRPFTPSSGGNRSATINVLYNPGSRTYSIPATGVGLVPIIDVTGPINFGALPVVDGLGAECGSYEREEVISIFNKGQAILDVTSVTCAAGDCTDFTVLSPVTFPENVQPAQTITVRIRFNPTESGARSATIRVASNAGTVDIPVSGIGLIGEPSLTPKPVIFDPTVVGFEPSCFEEKVITLYNRGPSCIKVDSISIIEDETGSYEILEAPATPFILGAGKGIPIKVKFNPTYVQRKISAKLEVITDQGEVSEKTVTADLCGEGVNTGFRVLMYDKFGKLLEGSSKELMANGFVEKIQVASKGIKPAARQTFLAGDLLLKAVDGCVEGTDEDAITDDIKFHLEYALPPTYTMGKSQASFKVTVRYFTATWKKAQKYTFTMELPACGGFKTFKIQATR
jgi:hypothetical protein